MNDSGRVDRKLVLSFVWASSGGEVHQGQECVRVIMDVSGDVDRRGSVHPPVYFGAGSRIGTTNSKLHAEPPISKHNFVF